MGQEWTFMIPGIDLSEPDRRELKGSFEIVMIRRVSLLCIYYM